MESCRFQNSQGGVMIDVSVDWRVNAPGFGGANQFVGAHFGDGMKNGIIGARGSTPQ
jgi:hypothetical protein